MKSRLIGPGLVLPFILITTCFALWGFANDITNPMVQSFKDIFDLTTTEGAFVQVAFYGGYFAMAFPAAIYVQRHSYKAGVLIGLGLYATGAFLFFPARLIGSYTPFLLAYFIMTCGLSFLETSCNPYILSMGSPETATRRLNLAQSFNPMGSLAGMFVAMSCIQMPLSRMSTASTTSMASTASADADASTALATSAGADVDAKLDILTQPYLWVGLVIAIVFVVIWLMRMPKKQAASDGLSHGFGATMKRLLGRQRYREGVVAQFFYVGAQIMCWTFIIQYGMHILAGQESNGFEQWMYSLVNTSQEAGDATLGVISSDQAKVLAQGYNILAMVIFCCSRFVCTFFLRYVKPHILLGVLAVAGIVLTAGVIGFDSRMGIYCLVGVSACMSLMFPTIYGMALTGVGEDAKLGAAGLIMAIVGGSVLPPVQAAIIDCKDVLGLAGENASFILPLICFVVISVYAARSHKTTIHRKAN